MAKHLILCVFGGLVMGQTAFGQFGMNIAASIGSSAGRRISEQINSSLRQGTRGFGTAGAAGKAGKAGGANAGVAKAAPAPPPPPPPPPPLHRAVPSSNKTTAPAWMIGPTRAFIGPPAPPEPPVNVDLAQVEPGMARETLLALGKPTTKMTLFEDGHMVEVYQYRNQTVASGTVRLRDGAVATVQARP